MTSIVPLVVLNPFGPERGFNHIRFVWFGITTSCQSSRLLMCQHLAPTQIIVVLLVGFSSRNRISKTEQTASLVATEQNVPVRECSPV